MSQATQRAALYTIVSGVADIGKVYNRERWALTWEGILALLKTTIDGTDQIRGWMITCLGFQDQYLNSELVSEQKKVAVLRQSTWRIQGFITFNDGDDTEDDALELGTSVVTAMNVADSLHDGTVYFDVQPPASLDVFELRILFGVLCHYVEIRQQLTEVLGLSQ